jgi:hypothetical protein
MFSARGVALNVTAASVQLRVLHNSVYLSARLKLRSTNSSNSKFYFLQWSLLVYLPLHVVNVYWWWGADRWCMYHMINALKITFVRIQTDSDEDAHRAIFFLAWFPFLRTQKKRKRGLWDHDVPRVRMCAPHLIIERSDRFSRKLVWR